MGFGIFAIVKTFIILVIRILLTVKSAFALSVAVTVSIA